jgi:hypothetical protein
MKKSLVSLLNQLDLIADEHDEVSDTYVRDQMRDAITRALLNPEPGYSLPNEYGMFSPEGNSKVKAALSKFIDEVKIEVVGLGLLPPKVRLNDFQDIEVQSRRGNTYDEYFGHADGI